MTENDVLALIVIAAAVVKVAQVVKADRDHKRNAAKPAPRRGQQ